MEIQNIRATVVSKKVVNNVAILLNMSVHVPIEYKAGQYFSFIFSDKLRRSYSVTSTDCSSTISFAIKIDDGEGSQAISELKLGSNIDLLGPLGKFTYIDDGSKILVFIATGIGIAPIKGIIDNLLKNSFGGKVYLFWGVRNEKIFIYDFSLYPIKFTPVVSAPEGNFENVGHVQDFIKKLDFPENTSFYICGSPMIVNEIRSFIKSTFVVDYSKIYVEKF